MDPGYEATKGWALSLVEIIEELPKVLFGTPLLSYHLVSFVRGTANCSQPCAMPRKKPPSGARGVALRRNEEHFEALVSGVEDYAIFLLSPEGNVISWNAGAQRMNGYKP